VIWAALMLMIALAAPGVWAWYFSRRQLAATEEAQQWHLLRLAAFVSAGVGVAILIIGAVVFVLTGYNWFVLALTWSFGLFHLGLLALTFRRAQKRTGRAGPAR
jgi:hypothetical protein